MSQHLLSGAANRRMKRLSLSSNTKIHQMMMARLGATLYDQPFKHLAQSQSRQQQTVPEDIEGRARVREQ